MKTTKHALQENKVNKIFTGDTSFNKYLETNFAKEEGGIKFQALLHS